MFAKTHPSDLSLAMMSRLVTQLLYTRYTPDQARRPGDFFGSEQLYSLTSISREGDKRSARIGGGGEVAPLKVRGLDEGGWRLRRSAKASGFPNITNSFATDMLANTI